MASPYQPLIILILVVTGIILSTSRWKVNPFFALFAGTIIMGLGSGLGGGNTIILMQEGFGRILGNIGLIVALGCILGVILEQTGAVFRLAALVLMVLGKRAPHAGMGLLGALTGIPVFCDSGYVILSRLNKPVAGKSGTSLPAIAMSLAAGLYITHTLVPPTPGPVAAAANLGLQDNLGLMILFGAGIALPSIILVSTILNIIFKGAPLKADTGSWEEGKDLAFGQVVAPVLVPVFLIALGTLAKYLKIEGWGYESILFLGNPPVALFIGVLLSMTLIKKGDRKQTSQWIGDGIRQAAPILLLTGMGGAFGHIIAHTSLIEGMGAWLDVGNIHPVLFLLTGFLLTAFLKTAQGSSTSALVIGTALIAPFAIPAGFTNPHDMVFLALSMGAGAMTVSHANDSFFWVVTQFSGFSVKQGYQYFTVTTALCGVLVMGMVVIFYLFWGLLGA